MRRGSAYVDLRIGLHLLRGLSKGNDVMYEGFVIRRSR